MKRPFVIKIHFLFISVFILLGHWVNGQEDSGLFEQIENFLEEQDEEVDVINLFDRLKILSEHPLDLNKSTAEQLFELRLLSEVQINQLFEHIELYGDLIAIEELQSIPSFTIEDINRLRSFVSVNSGQRFQMSIPQMIKESRNVLYLKWARILEEKRGFTLNDDGEPRYLGDENRLLVRYRNNFENRFRMGFILEKDPGEQMFQSGQTAGFDYFSFHTYLKDYSHFLKDLSIGDYSISLGQGLISHNSFGSGKGGLVTRIINGGRVIRPYSSVFENGYYRGLAATVRPLQDLELTVFGSKVKRDGNVQSGLDTLETEALFTSLQTSGNHRTVSEIEDRHSIGMITYGGSLKYVKRKGHVAINAMHHEFDKFLTRSEDLFNRFRFGGDRLTNVSIDYKYRYRNFTFFGESAAAVNQGSAHILGSLISLNPRLDLALHYRNYGKDYNALQPNAFGESSTINNENGFYSGLVYRISNKWIFRTYLDIWKHPWLRANISRPSTGSEYLFKLDYYLKRKLYVYAQYTFEQKYDNYIEEDSRTTQTGIQERRRVRLHVNNKVSPNLELRTRMEYSFYSNPIKKSNGYLFYQDFIYKSNQFPLSFTSRIAFFDTDDFDSRIFAYENALLYEFGIPSYFDQGVRYYVNLRYRATNNITAEMRFAKTHLTNRDSFSSGNEFIDGDTRSDLRFQLRIGF